jgi:hypothetical protein
LPLLVCFPTIGGYDQIFLHACAPAPIQRFRVRRILAALGEV